MKIVVIGCAGSGKTSFSRQLSKEITTSYYSLDDYYWNENWKKTDPKEFNKIVKDIVANENWIVEGLYPELVKEVDNCDYKDIIIIYLKVSRLVSLYRVTKRTIRRVITKQKICNGNIESIKSLISRNNIIFYAIRTYKKTSEICESLIREKPSSYIVANEKDYRLVLSFLKEQNDVAE